MSVQTARRELPFDRVTAVVRRGRKLRLTGILQAADALEEVRVLRSGVASRADPRRRMRAFLVRGESLSGEGLQAGDHVLIDETNDPPCTALLLVKVGGVYVLRTGSELLFDVRCQPQILGVLIAIVRRRGFNRPMSARASTETAARPPGKLRILQGQLGMLEATCASTRNPKLQDALRNEADRVRRQLQFGAPVDKLS